MKRNTFHPKISGERGSILYEIVRFFWVGGYRLAGWSFKGELPEKHHFVAIGAPHTSNWDFPIWLAMALQYRINVAYMAKHTLFKGPFGWLFYWLGGIPVERSQNHNLVDQAAEAFAKFDQMMLAITPEGTRSHAKKWKSGFYHIAEKAKVDIVPAFIDYKAKKTGFFPAITPTGDYEADVQKLAALYDTVEAKNPEQKGEYL
jgi:1-acyl-sn-glycerol-3-phosphate acyltransferase